MKERTITLVHPNGIRTTLTERDARRLIERKRAQGEGLHDGEGAVTETNVSQDANYRRIERFLAQ